MEENVSIQILYLSVKIKEMSKIRVKQTKSSIKKSQKQKRTLKALGLHRIGDTAEHEVNPSIKGMIDKVQHLVSVEEA